MFRYRSYTLARGFLKQGTTPCGEATGLHKGGMMLAGISRRETTVPCL